LHFFSRLRRTDSQSISLPSIFSPPHHQAGSFCYGRPGFSTKLDISWRNPRTLICTTLVLFFSPSAFFFPFVHGSRSACVHGTPFGIFLKHTRYRWSALKGLVVDVILPPPRLFHVPTSRLLLVAARWTCLSDTFSIRIWNTHSVSSRVHSSPRPDFFTPSTFTPLIRRFLFPSAFLSVSEQRRGSTYLTIRCFHRHPYRAPRVPLRPLWDCFPGVVIFFFPSWFAGIPEREDIS